MGKIKIKFNIDNEAKIYSNGAFIAASGYKDNYDYNPTEDKETLLFKVKGKKATIVIDKNKSKDIQIDYSSTGQLKASFVNANKIQEKSISNEKHKEEELNQNDNSIEANASNTLSSKIVSLVATVAVIAIIIFLFRSLLGIGSDSDSDRYKAAAQQVINVENKYSLNSYYSVGKITTKYCDLEQSLGQWKMFNCHYTYNPLNGAGSVMLDRENKGSVYVAIKFNADDNFTYKFDSTIEKLQSKLD